jgi:hypothetical protein
MKRLTEIMDLVTRLDAEADEDEEVFIEARESIWMLEVRPAWRTPGTESSPDEYRIHLASGGPWVTGKLDVLDVPQNARFEYAGYAGFKTAPRLLDEEREALLTFARVFEFSDE